MTTTITATDNTTMETMARRALADLGLLAPKAEEQYGALERQIPLIIGERAPLTPSVFEEEAKLLDGALGGALDVSTPRAPVDFHFSSKEVVKSARETEKLEWLIVDDDVKGRASPASADGYDSDTTLEIEGEYAYANPADDKEARASRKRWCAPSSVEEEEEEKLEEGEVVEVSDEDEEAAPAPVVVSEPKKQSWAGAVPAKPRSAAQRAPKKLCLALPTGVRNATLAHGALFKGMAGGKREERPGHRPDRGGARAAGRVR
jgi:hypothetical protein